MTPVEFMRTVYLGDRGCKSILIDGAASETKIQINVISRVRSETWDFYSAEDLIDGRLVFEGVSSVSFEPPGPVPNGLIDVLSVECPSEDSSDFRFVFVTESVDQTGEATRVVIEILARSVALEDAKGRRIRE